MTSIKTLSQLMDEMITANEITSQINFGELNFLNPMDHIYQIVMKQAPEGTVILAKCTAVCYVYTNSMGWVPMASDNMNNTCKHCESILNGKLSKELYG